MDAGAAADAGFDLVPMDWRRSSRRYKHRQVAAPASAPILFFRQSLFDNRDELSRAFRGLGH